MNQESWYEEQKQRHFNNAEEYKTKRSVAFTTLIVCMLITGLVGGAAGGLITYNAGQQSIKAEIQAQLSELPADNTAPVSSQGQANPQTTVIPTVQANTGAQYTKTDLIAACAPSIVGIDVQTQGRTDWYGHSSVVSGSGSGIIISEDGYIITNNHVVSGASNIKVYLSDDTEYDATLIGTDIKTDLAVIKIEAKGLTPVVLGDSDKMEVGEDVVAIGNPLGELRGTSTSGMVSALSRTINIEGQDMTLMQTDAAINPGNSGGGLFNMRGELIGVVNAKIASTTTEGLGFAIPVNDAKDVLNDLISLGYVSGRAYLGVQLNDVVINSEDVSKGSGNDLQDFFGFFGSQGAYKTNVQIAAVVAGGAAERAGLKAGDFILAIDDKEVTTANEIAAMIREYNAGDVANIKIRRDGVEQTLTVTFDESKPQQ